MNIATPIVIISVFIWCAAALFVSITLSKGRKVSSASALLVTQPLQSNAEAIDEPQSSTAKSDRLLLNVLEPEEPAAAPEPVLKAAEAIDYKQADAEAEKRVRHAHAEASDLCQRHGMHKRYFNVGRRQSWRCER